MAIINIRNQQQGRRRGRGGPRPPQQGGIVRPDLGRPNTNRGTGNAAQMLEKYKALARDAMQAGDRVTAEYYYQYADHYFRVLNENRPRYEERQQRPQQSWQDQGGDGDAEPREDEDGYAGGDGAERGYQQQQRAYQQQPRGDRYRDQEQPHYAERDGQNMPVDGDNRDQRSTRELAGDREPRAERQFRDQRPANEQRPNNDQRANNEQRSNNDQRSNDQRGDRNSRNERDQRSERSAPRDNGEYRTERADRDIHEDRDARVNRDDRGTTPRDSRPPRRDRWTAEETVSAAPVDPFARTDEPVEAPLAYTPPPEQAAVEAPRPRRGRPRREDAAPATVDDPFAVRRNPARDEPARATEPAIDAASAEPAVAHEAAAPKRRGRKPRAEPGSDAELSIENV